MAGRIFQHHYQRLVVHPMQNVVNTPTCRIRYLPNKTERAMGAPPMAL